MRKTMVICALVGVLFAASSMPAFAGDSLYGKVIDVKRADLVVLAADEWKHDIRIFGVDVPKEGPIATRAREFVVKLVGNKNARMRFEGRAPNGEFVGRLFTDDPEIGIKDVGLELIRAGLARRITGNDYKYGELSAAEREAKQAKRGLWASV
jgi:endonuclease YncB( thermonuclease family)